MPLYSISVLRGKPRDPARAVPEFNRAIVQQLFRQLNGGVIVGADQINRLQNLARKGQEVNPVFFHRARLPTFPEPAMNGYTRKIT
jgi:hypothetical protein